MISDHSEMTVSAKLILFCHLVFTPTIFSKALPEPQVESIPGLEGYLIPNLHIIFYG